MIVRTARSHRPCLRNGSTLSLSPADWGPGTVQAQVAYKTQAPPRECAPGPLRFRVPTGKSTFTTLMLSECQALRMIPHQILKRVLSRLFIFKTSRMLFLKQNTKGGLPLNRSALESGINSITSLGCLVRSAALMGASRPDLSLGAQVAVFTALCALHYITSTPAWCDQQRS
jgi:hypothetical protein